MYQIVLVPLDGSKRAEAILPHVTELARRYSARVIFLQVVEPVTIAVGPEGPAVSLDLPLVGELMQQAQSYLDRLVEKFRSDKIEAQSQVVFSPVVPAILEVARHEKVDLIAMSSHGRTGLSQVFYGSVAAGVLHGVDRPLLLIRSADHT